MKEWKMNRSLWFKRKKYGWGWTPANMKGWTVVLVYLAAILSYPLFMEYEKKAISTAIYLVLTALLTIGLFLICYAKGERPSWNWGDEKK